MVFHYGSGKAIPGFDEPQPLSQAFDRAGYNFLSAIGFLIIAVATLLPWVLLGALAVWAWRQGRRRWGWGAPGYRPSDLPLETPPTTRRRKPATPGEA